jgi:methylenetetrahydrofolate dehydrogenase (NADP+)/methenyltetrahydrofolate cyclohydrolase
MPLILNGTLAARALTEDLRTRMKVFSVPPKLSIIQVGALPQSTLYVEKKKQCGKDVGIEVEHIQLPDTVSFEEIERVIFSRNNDVSVSGIIVQLPLPAHLEKQRVIDCVSPEKDVDGLTTINKQGIEQGKENVFFPATARGIISLLLFYKVPIQGKAVAVLGRSDLVGKPTALLLKKMGALVSVCHSKTENTREVTQKADIIVVAIGKPHFLDRTYIGKNQIVVDVGINQLTAELANVYPQKKIVGDVDFDAVAPHVTAISPVPGGVGPMTVISLMENVFSSACVRLLGRT